MVDHSGLSGLPLNRRKELSSRQRGAGAALKAGAVTDGALLLE
jgi:hypothetical protein